VRGGPGAGRAGGAERGGGDGRRRTGLGRGVRAGTLSSVGFLKDKPGASSLAEALSHRPPLGKSSGKET
jgi:hypothetical protein